MLSHLASTLVTVVKQAGRRADSYRQAGRQKFEFR